MMGNDKVKFTQIKKRKILSTWQHKNRKVGLVSFICCDPNEDYYFAISCFEKRCGLNECNRREYGCNKYVYYNSLNNGLLYKSFDECAEAVDQWFKIWE